MKHLYEFTEGGFYAAESKEEAFRIYDADCGEELAADDFKRSVPDDELIEVMGESPGDKWDDPREYKKSPTTRHVEVVGVILREISDTDPLPYWCLKVTAREWANELSHGEGHVFGGDY